jgi:putative phosphoribosyl transferase
MIFTDRSDAGRRLAARLEHLRDQDVVVLGLPRGGVAVAFEVARELGAALDVILVRKLGVPSQLELAMGAIGEGGVRVLDRNVIRRARVGEAELASVQQRERVELQRQVARFGNRPSIPLAGRTAVVVDDGIATGSTARAACEVVRAQGARRVVLAVPVAPPGWERRFQAIADELVCLATPYPFAAVGCSYQNFRPTRNDEVVSFLDRARELLAAAPTVLGRDGQPGVTP